MNPLSSYLSQPIETQTAVAETLAPVKERNAEQWEMAQKFEAAFISQMLTYTGFAEALTKSGGEDVASFSQFYMESIAEDITQQGGFGIAEKIYTYMEKKGDSHGELGRL